MKTLAQNFGEIKADYAAATPNRFRRRRNGLYGSADAHITQARYLELIEYARALIVTTALLASWLTVPSITSWVSAISLNRKPEFPNSING